MPIRANSTVCGEFEVEPERAFDSDPSNDGVKGSVLGARNGQRDPLHGYFGDFEKPDPGSISPSILANLHVGSLSQRFNMGPAAGQSEAPRRMTRMRVEVAVRLATLSPAPIFAEETHTLVVNPQGCGVKLSRALDPGIRVLLDGLPGGLQATARVA